jgi:hypothetical protein
MSSSGTYSFNPEIADLVLEAFDRIQIRPAAITQDHMASARRSANLIQVRWSNRSVNLWTVDEQVLQIVSGQYAYGLSDSTADITDNATVAVLEGWYRQNPNTSSQVDTFLQPISRTDWATLAQKTQPVSIPTSYWFDRLSPVPIINLWGTPTFTSGTYEFHFYRTRWLQDATPQGTITADIPYRFEEAWVAELAANLAVKWKPAVAKDLFEYSKEVWAEAAMEDRERVVLDLSPTLDGYYR